MKKSVVSLAVLICIASLVLFSCKSESEKPAGEKKENVTTNTPPKENTATLNNETPKEVKLTTEEQKKLNIFFSNFSEVGLKPFSSGSAADEELINFGVLHNYKNNLSKFEKVDNLNSKIKEEHVSASIKKYFGINFSGHKSTGDFKYKNGYYYVSIADGEAFTFSQVEKLNDMGGDKYSAYVNVYTAGSGWTGDVHASPKKWGGGGEEPVLTGSFKATISKTSGPKGESVYTLIDYRER
ncbi:MAG: hypothetical protein AB2L26_13535 [Ignavibacteria bacterium]